MSDITLNEIDELLVAIGANGNGKRGISAKELATARGISEKKARDMIRPLVVAGHLRQVTEHRGPQDGYLGNCTVKAYVRV